MTTPSDKLKKEYSSVNFWIKKLYRSTWSQHDLNYSDEDRAVRRQIENHIFAIKDLLRNHYSPKIGRAIVSEIE